jgi:hypothetical protein
LPASLRRAREAILQSRRHLDAPTNPTAYRNALGQAARHIGNAAAEARRIRLSDNRQERILTEINSVSRDINNALRIHPIRRHRLGASLIPDIYLESALAAIRRAEQSLRLRGNHFDSMADEALRSIPGSRGGRVRTDISPWPSLLNRSIQALQAAIRHLGPPLNPRLYNAALNEAEALLNDAGREVRRIMSGARQSRVLDQLSNAAIRIRAARSQARGRSAFVPGGRSLIGPGTSLRGAISHIQAAQNAVGLQQL